MVDITAVQAALKSTKTLIEIIKSIGEVTNGSNPDLDLRIAEARSAALDIREQIHDLQEEKSAIEEEIRSLKSKITGMSQWADEKARYALHPVGGTVVYALKKDATSSEPPHYLCTHCYEEGRKSILNGVRNSKGFYLFECPICNSKVETGYRSVEEPEYVE